MNGLYVSRYINEKNEVGRPQSEIESRSADEEQSAGRNMSDYINRTASKDDQDAGLSILITRGLPVETGAELARLNDAKERKADRTYRQYGGRMPRLGSHIMASFPYGISLKSAIYAMNNHAAHISDLLEVPLEGRIHFKYGAPDHCHFLVGTRKVVDGALGKKCRALDAVSEKADGHCIRVGDRILGQTIENLRADWARRMLAASGDLAIDHRSYARRGLSIVPVRNIPRGTIEYERRRGTSQWRADRRAEMDARCRQGCTMDEEVAGRRGGRKVDVEAAAEAARLVKQRAMVIFNAIDVPARARGNGDRSAAGLLEAIPLGLPAQAIAGVLATTVHASVRNTIKPTGKREPGKPTPCIAEVTASLTGRVQTSEFAVSDPPIDPLGHEPREHPTSSLEAAVALYSDAFRRGRQRVDRVEILADMIGLERHAFEEIAKSREEATPVRDMNVLATIMPPEFVALRNSWLDEDNQKRRKYRASKGLQASLAQGEGGAPARPGQASVDGLRSTTLSGPTSSTSALPDPHGRRSEKRGADLANIEGADSLSYPPLGAKAVPPHKSLSGARHQTETPKIEEQNVALHVDPHASSPRTPLPDLDAKASLRKARFDAHQSDLWRMAQLAGKPLSGEDLELMIAVRLRAAGHDKAEVEAILKASSAHGQVSERERRVEKVVEHTFSSAGSERLRIQPTLATKAQQIEARATARLYRRLRRDALTELQSDLAKVWAERRLRADEAAQRHSQRLIVLHDVRRVVRRAGRHDLLLSILSLMIELAILEPLIARQKKAASSEARELYEAAARASEQLKRARQEWLVQKIAENEREERGASPLRRPHAPASSQLNEAQTTVGASDKDSSGVADRTGDAELSRALSSKEMGPSLVISEAQVEAVVIYAAWLKAVGRSNPDRLRRIADIGGIAPTELVVRREAKYISHFGTNPTNKEINAKRSPLFSQAMASIRAAHVDSLLKFNRDLNDEIAAEDIERRNRKGSGMLD